MLTYDTPRALRPLFHLILFVKEVDVLLLTVRLAVMFTHRTPIRIFGALILSTVQFINCAQSSADNKIDEPEYLSGIKTSLGLLGQAANRNGSGISVGPNNLPVVAFTDANGAPMRAHAFRHITATSWEDLAYPSDGDVNEVDIAVDQLNNAIAIFPDSTNSHKVTIRKTGPVNLGAYSGSTNTSNTHIRIPSDNLPVIVFRDPASGDRAHVMKWQSGLVWTDLGYASTNSATGITLDLTSDGKPVVGYLDNALNRPRVAIWNSGVSWTDLGIPKDVNVDMSGCNSLVVDKKTNRPIVNFEEVSAGYKARVMRWVTGTTWEDLGFGSTGEGNCAPMAIGADGKPLVLSRDGGTTNFLHLMKWQAATSWKDFGTLNSSEPYSFGIAVAPNKSVYVTFANFSGTNMNQQQVWRID